MSEYGVRLVLATDSNFDALAKASAPGWESVVQLVKPFVAVLSNQSIHPIVGFSIALEFNEASGTPAKETSLYLFPDGLAPRGVRHRDRTLRQMEPGEDRVFPMAFQLPEFNLQFEKTLNEWAAVARGHFIFCTLVDITIDCAIFDDGHMIGPNLAELDVKFMALLNAKQKFYTTVLDAVDKGHSLDTAFESAAGQLEGDDYIATQFAKQEARGYRTQYGDSAVIEAFRMTLLKEPFHIKGR